MSPASPPLPRPVRWASRPVPGIRRGRGPCATGGARPHLHGMAVRRRAAGHGRRKAVLPAARCSAAVGSCGCGDVVGRGGGQVRLLRCGAAQRRRRGLVGLHPREATVRCMVSVFASSHLLSAVSAHHWSSIGSGFG